LPVCWAPLHRERPVADHLIDLAQQRTSALRIGHGHQSQIGVVEGKVAPDLVSEFR
jgi:hypothetical protein